jgi:hypothetical protein
VVNVIKRASQYVRGEFQLKLKYFFYKWSEIEEGSFLTFSSLEPSHLDPLFAALYLQHESLCVLTRGRHHPFLNSKGVIISYANYLFLAWTEVKSRFRPPDVWGREKNTPSGQTPLLLYPLLNRRQVHHKIIQKHMK